MRIEHEKYQGLRIEASQDLKNHIIYIDKGTRGPLWSALADSNFDSYTDLIRCSHDDVIFMINSQKTNYVLTAKAKEVIDNIKITDKVDFSFLSSLDGQVLFIHINTHLSFCVWIGNQDVKLIKISEYGDTLGEEDLFSSRALSYNNLLDAQSLLDLEDKNILNQNTTYLSNFDLVFRVIIFLKFTNPIVEIIEGRQSKQAPTSNQPANENIAGPPFPVSVVDSTWNKFIVRTEGFDVSGHFRLQMCGVGHSEQRLVWVNPYQKNGYVRKPKSQAEA
jgi:hypothetical protein